jgi:Uma2 family endonuclease
MTTPGPATIEDLLRTPDDGQKYELVDGTIRVSPAGMRHSEVGGQIAYLLKRSLEGTPGSAPGRVYTSDVGIVLPNGNVRSPDVCYVSSEKLPGGVSPETFGEVVPDLVVEVLSPGDRMRYVADKIGEYVEAGVPLIWLVDPRSRSVTVYRSLTDTEHLEESATICADPVLSGFEVKVAELFR